MNFDEIQLCSEYTVFNSKYGEPLCFQSKPPPKFKKCYSQGQIEWLSLLLITIPDIRHILNNEDGEFKIPTTRFRADGYSETTNTIFEYNGDFWHGNPKIYEPTLLNACTHTTFGELYENTCNKERKCVELGYKYYSIWESDWLRGKTLVIKLQRQFRVLKCV